jgi:hypothetical protein
MNKKTSTENIWDDNFDHKSTVKETEQTTSKTLKTKSQPIIEHVSADFDLEGLMTDFPTAKDLERFVYDETGVTLNLKGRANKLKYQVAMDVLNGVEVDSKFLTDNNPYLDKAEMIPTEDLKPTPTRDKLLPDRDSIQNSFYSPFIPHPDEEMRAKDKKVHMMFRKYKNGMISYEILGPLEQYPFGEKVDKFGRIRPEIIKWVDPRTGEQTVVREDGTLTPQGRKLRAMMQTKRVNKSNQWDVWVDREFVSLDDKVASNPWDLTS